MKADLNSLEAEEGFIEKCVDCGADSYQSLRCRNCQRNRQQLLRRVEND